MNYGQNVAETCGHAVVMGGTSASEGWLLIHGQFSVEVT
jgi:hypothetical protein